MLLYIGVKTTCWDSCGIEGNELRKAALKKNIEYYIGNLHAQNSLCVACGYPSRDFTGLLWRSMEYWRFSVLASGVPGFFMNTLYPVLFNFSLYDFWVSEFLNSMFWACEEELNQLTKRKTSFSLVWFVGGWWQLTAPTCAKFHPKGDNPLQLKQVGFDSFLTLIWNECV